MLDEMLEHLASLTSQAQARFDAEHREEDDEYEPEAVLWLTLEHTHIGRWNCGWRVQPDEATLWAFVASGRTPAEAAKRLLADWQ